MCAVSTLVCSRAHVIGTWGGQAGAISGVGDGGLCQPQVVSPLNLRCISAESPLNLRCISAVSPLYLR
eukprot:3702519-Rhodomonas_salina.1